MRAPQTPDPLTELRRARKRARTAGIDWVDAMYRTYVLTIVCTIAVVIASGTVGDAEVTAAGLADVRAHGPASIGLVAVAAACIGLRSGSRGGPLALEAADVRHVLLAPVDRARVLRALALRQLRHVALTGAGAGATAALLAGRRLPGDTAAWIVCGAATGALAGAAAIGAGDLAAGRRLTPRVANTIALVLLAWSAADLTTGHATSPWSLLGRLALWPMPSDGDGTSGIAGAAGAAVCFALAVAGPLLVGGLSIEAAERRSALIGRLAFAATLQDLRTVLVLRRQLAQEHARRRPWSTRVPLGGRWPVWDRGWRGVLRWPLVRIARIVVLVTGAGAALAGVAAGTTPLVVVAGLALYVAALDAIEALAQEVDHPSRTESFPMARGALHVRHLGAATTVLLLTGTLGFAVAFALRPEASTLAVGAATLVTAALGSVVGAALATIAGPPDPLSSWALGAPEIAGVHNLLRLVWPPALATIGCVPVVLAARAGNAALPRTSIAVAVALLLDAAIAAWIHARDDVLVRMRSLDLLGKPS